MELYKLINQGAKAQGVIQTALDGLTYDSVILYDGKPVKKNDIVISINNKNEILIMIKGSRTKDDKANRLDDVYGLFVIIKAKYDDLTKHFEITQGADTIIHWKDGTLKTWNRSFLETLNDQLPKLCNIIFA